MDGSPSAIITMGYGTGIFTGSPSLIVTLGYGVGAEREPIAFATFSLAQRFATFELAQRSAVITLEK